MNLILALLVIFGGVSYPVVQQDCAACVSPHDGVFTEFRMARDNGTVGLLAHDYLAGDALFALEVGDTVEIVFTDKDQAYRISKIWKAKALSNSPYGKFQVGSESMTAQRLFEMVYTGKHHLVLQTCKGEYRMFYIAYPIVTREAKE